LFWTLTEGNIAETRNLFGFDKVLRNFSQKARVTYTCWASNTWIYKCS